MRLVGCGGRRHTCEGGPCTTMDVAGVAMSAVFGYNREGFMFEGVLKQKRLYQEQAMRITQVELYREDIRDLLGFTVSKMDNYLLINALFVGFCIKVYTEGRPIAGHSTTWVLWLYAVAGASALLYFLLSMWLAMHASVSSHSFGVRLLTQFVRLAVPTQQELDAARTWAKDFEARRMGEILRVPLAARVAGRSQPLGPASQPSGLRAKPAGDADVEQVLAQQAQEVAVLRHVRQYRRVQRHWQAYDAYARVSMAAGINQLLFALGYYSTIVFLSENREMWPACCCAMVFFGSAWMVLRLDLFRSGRVLRRWSLALVAMPLLAVSLIAIEASSFAGHLAGVVDIGVPILYLLHLAWALFLVDVARPEGGEIALPSKFRAVLYLDVYGQASTPEPAAEGSEGAQGRLPPGRLPWRSFQQGSLCVAAVWLLGFAWAASARALRVDIPLAPPEARLELLWSGPRPHPLFAPRGLACHEDLGVLLHDRYRAYALSEPGLEAALQGCLAGELASLAVECRGGQCAALLLAADGRLARRCALGTGALEANYTLYGGPHLALAGGGAWALRRRPRSLLRMWPRDGSPGELLPKAEVTEPHLGAFMHEAGGALLNLDAGGLLRVWPGARSESVAWQLPRTIRWAGVCTSSEHLYFAGVTLPGHGDAGGTLGVWRARRPEMRLGAATRSA